MYAKQACSMHEPLNDDLFVETEMYTYDRWEQLSVGAWYMKRYVEGYDATIKALQIKPGTPHLMRNLGLYKRVLKISAPPKILNLILYSPSEHYDKMKDILTIYNKAHNIEHYFYCYKPDLKDDYIIIGNILYIRGEETYIPGILNKTLKAFEIFKDKKYDYIIRSNVSTVINYDELYLYLGPDQLDYGGPLYYVGPYVDLQAGMTEEKHKIYKNKHFISGCLFVLSRKAIMILVENTDEVRKPELVDDVAIGVYLHDKDINREKLGKESYSFDNNQFKPNILMYRNKVSDRSIDIKNMEMITNALMPK
jgi:hypothetical protein